MCHSTQRPTPNEVLDSYARWLGAAGQRIATGYGQMPLPIVVEAVLAELTGARRSFTAYDVTLALRALFPRRELPHYARHGAPGVQPEVHRQMAGYVGGGDYVEKMARPNGVDAACLYMPAPSGRGKGWPRLVPLPASAPRNVALPANLWVIGGQADSTSA